MSTPDYDAGSAIPHQVRVRERQPTRLRLSTGLVLRWALALVVIAVTAAACSAGVSLPPTTSGVLPTTSQPKQPAAAVRPLSRAETACNADLRTRGEPAAIPTPTRVADTTTVVGVRLAPSPVGYRPQIPASAAWHHADPYGEAGSTYYLYLARAWSAVPAKNGVPEFAGQHPRALSGLAVTSEDCATRSPVATHGFKAVGQPEWWGPFR